MFTRIVVVGVAVVALTSSGFAGRAAAAEGREAREREARKACFTGNVDRGVEILVDLYGETGHPNYIYNQARCFERNGKYDQALLSYEDYLRKAKDVGTAERADVEKAIAELRAKVGAGNAGSPRSGPVVTTPPPPSGAEPPPGLLTPELDKAGSAAPVLLDAERDTPADAAWPWQRTAGVISLVAAGGALALGVAGHVLREGRAGDFNDACYYAGGQAVAFADPGVDCRGRYDAVKSAETMMLIGYVGAGVLAGAGAALLVLAPRADAGSAHAGLARCAPLAGTTAGVVCGGSF
jgi:hypothetical protein